MSEKHPKDKAENRASKPGASGGDAPKPTQQSGNEQPKEIGGRDGPDPTRYGDWEKAGRCIDF